MEKSENATEIKILRSLLKSLNLTYDEDSFTKKRTRTDVLKTLASAKRRLDIGVYFQSTVVPWPQDTRYNVFLMYVLNYEFRINKFEDEIEEINELSDILLKRKSPKIPEQKSKQNKADEKSEEAERKRKEWIKVTKDAFLEIVSNGTYLCDKYEFPYEESLDILLIKTFNLLKNWTEVNLIIYSIEKLKN